MIPVILFVGFIFHASSLGNTMTGQETVGPYVKYEKTMDACHKDEDKWVVAQTLVWGSLADEVYSIDHICLRLFGPAAYLKERDIVMGEGLGLND